jgi:hypothetical protein
MNKKSMFSMLMLGVSTASMIALSNSASAQIAQPADTPIS